MSEANYITLGSTDGDLSIVDDSFVLTTNSAGIAQKLQHALMLRLGSCMYDIDAGFPWDRLQGADNTALIDTLLRSFLRKEKHVRSIDSIDIVADGVQRTLTARIVVTTELGDAVPIVFDTLPV